MSSLIVRVTTIDEIRPYDNLGRVSLKDVSGAYLPGNYDVVGEV